jgi:integrase
MHAQITDRSGVTSQCTYTADNGFTRSFALNANSTSKLDIVPEGLVPHGLRHTTAALAISAGANVKVVQRLLGHATAAMTLDRYGHLLNDDLTGVADALGKAIDSTAVSLRYSEWLNEVESA